MALPSSGALSLNAMHVEAGGSSGTSASINDSDIRGLISKASGAQMSFSEWYGASNTVWTTDLTVGYLFGKTNSIYGFNADNAIGSLSDNTVDFKSGAICENLAWGTATQIISFAITGNVTNAGFTTMTVNGNSFNRTSATYNYNSSGNFTEWYWSQSTLPFSGEGNVDTVTFT